MGHRNPRMMASLVGPIASYARDAGLRLEIVRAMCRIAERAPDVVRPHRELLHRWRDPGCEDALDRLDGLLADETGGTS